MPLISAHPRCSRTLIISTLPRLQFVTSLMSIKLAEYAFKYHSNLLICVHSFAMNTFVAIRQFSGTFNLHTMSNLCLHSYASALMISRPSLSWNSAVLLHLLLWGVFLLLICAFVSFVSRRNSKTWSAEVRATRRALHALLAIINPTRSIWYSVYLASARRAVTGQEKKGRNCIEIPLRVLWDDVVAGRIEFRNPRVNIPELLKGRLKAKGYRFNLQFDVSLCMFTLGWLMAAQLSTFKAYCVPNPHFL